MLPDRVSNPGPLTYESGALPTALRGPATDIVDHGQTAQNEQSDQGRHCLPFRLQYPLPPLTSPDNELLYYFKL